MEINKDDKSSKRLAEIKISAIMANTGEAVDFYIFGTREVIEKAPEENLKKELKELLKVINIDMPFVMKGLTVPYESLVSAEIVEPENYGYNTVVQVNLPYCLNIPSNYPLAVKLDNDEMACIRPKKIWTGNATDSSEADFLTNDKVSYFNNPDIITPRFPQEEKIGWALKFTGKNIEKARDNTGYFRYTKLNLYFDTSYTKDEVENIEDFNKGILKEIIEKSYILVNKLLDVYRVVTEEDFIERVGYLNIVHIFFLYHKKGFLLTSPGYGNIQSAVMNRSRQELQRIEDMLEDDIRPELYELLFLNAINSIKKRMFPFAVVESFQALEIFLENFLIEKFTAQEISEVDINIKLRQQWTTKDRLKVLLKEATGKSLFPDNQPLWDRWCSIYDNIRNEVIHKGKEIEEDEAKKVLTTNKEIILWIKSLV